MKQNLASLFFAIIAVTGCGGGGGSGDTVATKVEIQDRTISVGEKTVVRVEFSYDSDRIFSDDEEAIIAVQLPSSVSFVAGSSEIDTIFGDDTIGAQVTNCPTTGEQFIVFAMDKSDLLEAENPSGDGDARLTFSVMGDSATPLAIIAARGNDSPTVTCGEPFFADAQGNITIFSADSPG